MTPGRRKLAAVLVAIGALIYGISPIDVIPDLLLPFGIIDDGAVLLTAGIAVWRLLSGRGKPGTPPATPPAA
jgi:uncharacterized membrane protein YkvA (DUF1232 family)